MKKRILIALVVVLALAVTASLVWANADGLVSYWPFDEGEGTTATDVVNGNNGTIVGATWVDGKVDHALSFDGTYTGIQADGDYVLVPGPSSLHITDKLTLEAWIKPTGLPDRWYGDVVRLGQGYELCLRGDGKLEIALYRSGAWGWWDSVSAIPIPATNFYHVAFTYDKDGGANNLKIYINGALDAQYTVGTGALQSSGDLWISPWFWPFEGTIDEVGIWDRALSAEEVFALSLSLEWLPPLALDDWTLNENATLPIKFQLYGPYGNLLCTDLSPTLEVNGGTLDPRFDSEDPGACYYIANFRPGAAAYGLRATVRVNGVEVGVSREFDIVEAGTPNGRGRSNK